VDRLEKRKERRFSQERVLWPSPLRECSDAAQVLQRTFVVQPRSSARPWRLPPTRTRIAG